MTSIEQIQIQNTVAIVSAKLDEMIRHANVDRCVEIGRNIDSDWHPGAFGAADVTIKSLKKMAEEAKSKLEAIDIV